MADEWARSPPAVSGVSCDPGDEKAKMLSPLCTIPGVGLKQPPPRVVSVFPVI
jgi:hypothetical protein